MSTLYHASFFFEGRKRSGDYYVKRLDEVRAAILRAGGIPIHIERHRVAAWRSFTFGGQRLAIHLLEALAYRCATTVSPARALADVIDNEPDRHAKAIYHPARVVIEAGGDFADALGLVGLFDQTVLGMLMAGEQSGDLVSAIKGALAQMRLRSRRLRELAFAVVFVVSDLWVTLGMLQMARHMLLPHLSSAGIQTNDNALRTWFHNGVAVVHAANSGMIAAWWSAILIASVFLAHYWPNRRQPDHWAVRGVHRAPFLRAYFRDLGMHSGWLIFAQLLSARVSIGKAVDIVRGAAWVHDCRLYWEQAIHRLRIDPPEIALARPPLTSAERMHLTNARLSEQLAEVAAVIAAGRDAAARARQRRLMWGFMVGSSLFAGASFAMAAYLVWMQQESSKAMMDYMRQGMFR
jgi:type II secretory pathway component PulF